MSADGVYYAHRRRSRHRGGPAHYYEHASPDRWWVELHALDHPIVAVRVRERRESDPPSPYWAWLDAERPDRYRFVQPSRGLFDMCFTYGPSAEEARGRGRAVNVVVEEVPEPAKGTTDGVPPQSR